MAAGDQSANTIRVRRSQLTRASRALGPDPWAVTQADLFGWIGRYESGASGRKGLRDALRSFYRWAAISGLVESSPAAVLPSVRVQVGMPRPAPASAVIAAIEAADDRTRLAIHLGMYAGLRRMEIAKVHTRDLRDGSLYVIGKGGKHRLVPIHRSLQVARRGD